jgi:hypothetical protein
MKKILFALAILLLSTTLFGCLKTANTDESVDWVLVSGTEPTADPDPLVYEGNVTAHGYLVMASPYVGNAQVMLKIVKDDLNNFPNDKFDTFLLKYNGKDFTESPELLAKLNQSSEQNPAELEFSGLTYVMEGAPTLTLKGFAIK